MHLEGPAWLLTMSIAAWLVFYPMRIYSAYQVYVSPRNETQFWQQAG